MSEIVAGAEKVSVYNQRFNYQPLDRVTLDGKRHYATPDGKKLPSVTTILDRTKPEEKKQALNEWKRRMGHERAQQITTEAANRGTRMHSYLEYYIKEGRVKECGTNPFAWASHAMAQVVIDEGLHKINEFWGVEVPLYFPGIYAGTTDCVGVHEGTASIMDFKQTNKPKKEEWIDDYKLQLAAYAEAHNEVHGTDIRKGVVLMCVKPDVSSDGQVMSTPKYQEFVVEGDEFEHWRQEWWKRVELYYLTA
jgi:genome maintenance exonuclease 1